MYIMENKENKKITDTAFFFVFPEKIRYGLPTKKQKKEIKLYEIIYIIDKINKYDKYNNKDNNNNILHSLRNYGVIDSDFKESRLDDFINLLKTTYYYDVREIFDNFANYEYLKNLFISFNVSKITRGNNKYTYKKYKYYDNEKKILLKSKRIVFENDYYYCPCSKTQRRLKCTEFIHITNKQHNNHIKQRLKNNKLLNNYVINDISNIILTYI